MPFFKVITISYWESEIIVHHSSKSFSRFFFQLLGGGGGGGMKLLLLPLFQGYGVLGRGAFHCWKEKN